MCKGVLVRFLRSDENLMNDNESIQINTLTRGGLSGLRDVLLDIRKQLDFSVDGSVEIPMWPPYSWDERWDKSKAINHDEYENSRKKVISQLVRWEIAGDCQFLGGRFRNYIQTKINQEKYQTLLAAVLKRWDEVSESWKVANLPIDIRPRFNETNSEISLGDKTISIQRGSIQYAICRAVFENPGTWVGVTDILTGYDSAEGDERQIYQATRAINAKSRVVFNRPNLLLYRAARVRLALD